MKKYIVAVFTVLLALCLVACGGPKEVTNMSYSASHGDTTMNGLFTGTVVKKQPNGQGTFTYSDSFIQVSYIGNWENGIPVGEGKLEYVSLDGETVFNYSGEWKAGVIAGKGKLEFNKLAINFDGHDLTGEFSGEVVDGVPCGSGEFTTTTEASYLTYKGNWKNGAFSEAGTIDTNIYTVHFKDGISRTGKYVGNVYNGLAEGEGTFEAVNSDGIPYSYVGEWKNGLYNGTGTLHWDADDVYTQKGTFVAGEFFPTPVEYFISIGTYPDRPYTITKNALTFLEKYPEVFLENEVNNNKIEYEKNFTYKAFEKNPSKYGTKLITVPSLRVVQIFEGEYWGDKHTFIIADNGNNFFYVNLYGHWDNVYEGSYIKLTALPLAYFTYPNIYGNKIWAIACAGVRIN